MKKCNFRDAKFNVLAKIFSFNNKQSSIVEHSEKTYKTIFMEIFSRVRVATDSIGLVKWGYPKTFERGCLKEESWSRCKEYTFQDERVALHCQFTCSEHDCNLGTIY